MHFWYAASLPFMLKCRTDLTTLVDLPADLIDGGSVVATLYYQSIPPSYLLDRFTAADGDATRRLYYCLLYTSPSPRD